jgi:hypothetical protein
VKKIHKYYIIVIALITGAMAINIYIPQSKKSKVQFSQEDTQYQSSEFYINSFQIDVPDNCKTNEEIRVIHNLQISTARVLVNNFSHSINQSSRLTNSKLFSYQILYLYFQSNKQTNGRYLYSQRKLLI